MSLAAQQLLDRVLAGKHLEEAQATELLKLLGTGEVPPALAGALLIALRNKGETAAEIRGFALGMRELALRPVLPEGAYVDIVGTGGDGSSSLNLSTGSALLAAAAGARVVKHGNRSISSRSGSADVLAALGLPVPLDAAAAARALERLGFTFLFAPHYHPAMKHIAPVRAALGVRTVFNILGPLANPAAPPYHVIGAFSEAVAALMADTLAGMPLERAFVVHGEAGWDEPTQAGPFIIYDVRPGRVQRSVRDASDLGLPRCALDELRGADAASNAARLRAALCGEDTAAHRDALTLGAALALEVTGAAPDARRAVARVREALAGGEGRRLLDAVTAFGQEPRP
ncbi:MAG TPA: anthranilate phosphoribosyltransferase [Gammaproteobacteria bacterium]|nr:anthranilate phosphoribosyltransferase [Gammaproteobacteria bacterium]